MAAITFPLSLADLADRLQIKKAPFQKSDGRETSGMGSGVIRVKDLRPMLWIADVELVPMCHDEAAAIFALLEMVDDRGGTFLFYDPRRVNPIAGPVDDTGVEIKSLGADGISLALQHAPIGHVISVGDMLSYTYGGDSFTDPSKALHRVVQAVTVDGSHNTTEFEVYPAVPTGAEVGAPVALVKPCAVVMIVPATLNLAQQDTQFDIITFTVKQVI